MNRLLAFAIGFVLSAMALYLLVYRSQQADLTLQLLRRIELNTPRAGPDATSLRLQQKARAATQFVQNRGFSNRYAFFIDMGLPSGKNRFFVYDLKARRIITSALVAHGSCRSGFLETARFANIPDCGCSSEGRYKIGYAYEGQFGKAYKLYGLDSTNSHAFRRNVVLHAYSGVPDEEIAPQPLVNSLGCPMVSYRFLAALAGIIDQEAKPVLLWIYQ